MSLPRRSSESRSSAASLLITSIQAQKEALRKLFSGPSFAGMGQVAELKEAAIKFENLDAFG